MHTGVHCCAYAEFLKTGSTLIYLPPALSSLPLSLVHLFSPFQILFEHQFVYLQTIMYSYMYMYIHVHVYIALQFFSSFVCVDVHAHNLCTCAL